MKACGKVAANLQNHIDVVVPPKEADEEEEIWAGVGFGPNFYHQVKQTDYVVRSESSSQTLSTGAESSQTLINGAGSPWDMRTASL